MKKSSKNTILIISGIFKPDIGGPSIFANSINEYIENSNHKSYIITLSNIEKSFIREKNILRVSRNLPKPLRTFLLIYFINKFTNKSESILCCGLILETFLGTLFSNKRKIYRFVGDSIWEKYIGSKDKGEFQDDFNSLELKFLFKFRDIILKKFSMIVTPSFFLKEYLISTRKLNPNKIKVISNFADLDNIKINSKLNSNISGKSENIKLITLSRLVKWKNIDKLIMAVSYLKNIKLYIVGNGPEESNLKKLASKSKNKSIFFYNDLSRNKCLNLLNNSDCFVQISSYEGMSFSILESLKLGKAMILSSISPNFETAKNSAIYVDPNSLKEIKSSIKIIRCNKIRSNLENNSRKISEKYYSKNDSLNQYLNILLSKR